MSLLCVSLFLLADGGVSLFGLAGGNVSLRLLADGGSSLIYTVECRDEEIFNTML